MTTMTTSEPTYHTLGIRTRRGVYWSAVFFATLVVITVITDAVFTDQGGVRTAFRLTYAAAVFLVTTRILRRLRVLELARPEPDDGMKLAFRCALGFPIIAYLPFLLHLVK